VSDESLPPGWAKAKFEEILIDPKADLVDGPFGSNLKSSEYVESGVPVLKIQNIKADRFVRKHFSYVTTKKADELSRHSFVPGDLMITKLGDPLGLCCEVPKDFPAGVFVADLMRLRLRTNKISKRFLLLAINSQVVQSQFKEITKGTTRPRVNLTIVRKLELPLPPLAEQKRIVAKIEELFSELEAGEESLRVARRQLGVYRQSLLKQAFEGKLTARWRTQNPDKLESPAQLLARIQSEASDSRRSRVRQKVDDSETNAPAVSVNLPEGWIHLGLRDLGTAITGNTPPTGDEANYGNEVPFVKPPDLTNHPVSKTQAYLSKRGSELGRVLPERCVLVTCIGNLGRVGINRVPVAFNQQINAVVPHPSVDPFYLFYAAQSPVFRHQLEGMASATTISIVNKGNFEKILVPLCSLSEQQEIVRLLDEQFEAVERNEREIDAALKRSEALRQSILKKAFTGQLVPQVPSDEPASALLARLRSERSRPKP